MKRDTDECDGDSDGPEGECEGDSDESEGDRVGTLIGPMLMLGALLGESVGAEGPMLDGVAVGAADGAYVKLYVMVLDGNAVGSKYVTDLN